MYTAYLLIIIGLFAYLSWRDLRWGLFVIAATLPSYLLRFHIGPVPSTVLEAMALILFALWFWKKRKNVAIKKYLKAYPVAFILIGLIIVSSTIAIFIAPDFMAALGIWKAYFIEPILLSVVTVDLIRSKNDFKKIIAAFAITCFYISIIAIYQKLTAWNIPVAIWRPEESRRVTFFFNSPNAIGLLLGPMVVLVFAWLQINIKNLYQKFHHREFLIALVKLTAVILGLLSIQFAVSRAALVATLLSMGMILFFTWSKKWIITCAIVLVALLTGITPLNQKIWDLATFQVNSGQLRKLLYESTGRMIEDNFIFGVGLAGFGPSYEKYKNPLHTEELIYPHNYFLNFWVEIGLLGMIAMTLVVIYYFWLLKNKPQDQFFSLLRLGLLAAMIEILIHGMVDAPYFKNDLAMLFWILLSLAICYSILHSKGQQTQKKISNA